MAKIDKVANDKVPKMTKWQKNGSFIKSVFSQSILQQNDVYNSSSCGEWGADTASQIRSVNMTQRRIGEVAAKTSSFFKK